MKLFSAVQRLAVAVSLFAVLFLCFSADSAIPAGYPGVPFCCDTLKGHYQQIPGIVKSVFFDSGGNGVAYHYPGGNQGGSMRLNAAGQQIQADFPVSMQSYSGNDWDVVGYGTSDQHDSSVGAVPTTWHLSWIDAASPTDPGEWLKYTVHVNVPGMYYVSWKQATANANGIEALTYYNGTSVKADSIKNIPVCITPQGCPEVWHAWTVNQNVDSVVLDTGLQVVQLAFISGSWNFDWMDFVLHAPANVMQTGIAGRQESGAMKVNPVENSLNVSFSLAQAGRTSFSIVDCRGRQVGNPVTKFLMSGTQSQSLPLGKLSPGVYFMQMEHSGIMSESRFFITR
jgi:hypothetical protein